MTRDLFILALLIAAIPVVADERPNILFIAIDDLRPELGCYGSEIVQSPNIDALAAEGLRFDRAYCQQAICSPSRASLMTGARPDDIGVIENTAYFRELNPDIVTLPQQFIAHGYETAFSGKIFHSHKMCDLELSWSKPIPRKAASGLKQPKTPGGYATAENQALYKKNREIAIAKYGEENSRGLIHGPAFEAGPVEDEAYSDGYATTLAIDALDELVEGDKPWFLAMGYKKPHLPFVAPKRYFDLYDPAAIKLASQSEPATGAATIGLHASFELRTRANIPKYGEIDEHLSRDLLHAYYACTSYVDAQIGRLLGALEKHGVRENTLVVLWGDHGWHLGEMGIWGKATNYEIATRVPLIVSAPGMKAKGEATEALVELIDIFPTLCEYAGIPVPENAVGKSFLPLLDDPAQAWKPVAVSQFPSPALREWAANPLSDGMRETFFGPLIEDVETSIKAQFGKDWDRELFEQHLMGYTVRSRDHRLVLWRDYRDHSSDPLFVELFDHRIDPDETRNVASEQPEVVSALSDQLNSLLTK
ncbi:MAG: sulfatase [Verrucomicrobiota bacterium]